MADLVKELLAVGGANPAEGLSIGVDMGAKPSGTAVAGVRWPSVEVKPALVFLQSGCPHEEVGALLAEGDFAVAAVDVPFGWPRPFVEMVSAHAAGPLRPVSLAVGDRDVWRTHTMALRQTDICVKKCFGIRPISASFDKLGSVAAAWALVEAQISAHRDEPFDRTGGLQCNRRSGSRIIETYPAAQVEAWERHHRFSEGGGAETQRQTRAQKKQKAVRNVTDAIGLALGEHSKVRDQPSHALDALICALTAALMTRYPGEAKAMLSEDHDASIAQSEGVIWLHDPTREVGPTTCC